jgi:RNA polymerase sigma-70 factor (ECF subfamily)
MPRRERGLFSERQTWEVAHKIVCASLAAYSALIHAQEHRQCTCPTWHKAYNPRLMTDTAVDSILIHRAKAGELTAFEELVSRYEARVYTLARRMVGQEQDAEDVTQQAFLSALEHLDDFREEASFYTWLMRIATHAALKLIRKRKGLPTVSLEEMTEPQEGQDTIPHPEFIADWRQSPEELVQRHEIQRLLDEALAQLDEKHRLVFLLRDVEGMSVRETAAALGLSEANVKVRLLRARLQLRELLTRELGDPARRLIRPAHSH